MSDQKALLLQKVSDAIKRLADHERHDCPEWTTKVEELLSPLPIGSLVQLEFELVRLDAGIQRDMLPT